MKTKIFVASFLIVCIGTMLIAPAMAIGQALEKAYIQDNPDPQYIKLSHGGFIVEPTNDDVGEPKTYGVETLWVTKDTKNLEYVFDNVAPGGKVKLTEGTYYISKNIIGRKSMTLIGKGMDKTTIIAKGAKVGGDYEDYPLAPKIEATSFAGVRVPVVFRFTVSDDSEMMNVTCKDLTIRTEGKTETWYRYGYHMEGFQSHASAIVVTGNNPGEFDGIVNRIDLEAKNVRIQGTDSNQPYWGVSYIPSGIIELLDDETGLDRYTAEDGIAFHIHAFEPANGKVEFDGCRFENISNTALVVNGVSSLPLPPFPAGSPVESWLYPNDWTPGMVRIKECCFEDTGFAPCPFSGTSYSIWIADLSNADCKIIDNTFVDIGGAAVGISGGLSLTGMTGGDPQEWVPLPATSRYDVSDNNIQLIPEFDADGMFLFDFGPILAGSVGFPPCAFKTLDLAISDNEITFNRELFAVLGIGLCDAHLVDNRFEGSGLAAICLGVSVPPDLPTNPAINCKLGDNEVDDFTALVAPIILGPWSSYCTVKGTDLSYVLDQGTNNLVKN